MKLAQVVSCITISLISCVEPYVPELKNETFDILVVDGYINTTDNSARVQLSRAVPLDAAIPPSQEVNATVIVEDESGSTSYTLNNMGLGLYFADNLTWDHSKKYRVHVYTNADEQYLSDFVQLTISPPIDSVTWALENGGISIRVNTHDPQAQSNYYEWAYEETWEYVSSFFSTYKMVDGTAVQRTLEDRIYQCWSTEKSTKILVGTSERLSEDVIRNFPVAYVPGESSKLNRRYSIEVSQRVISKEEFDFKLQLEKTTESLGGLFDPMPSQVLGNIHSANNASSPVLGYFSGGGVSKKRVFIAFADLPIELQVLFRPPVCNAMDVSAIPVDAIPGTPNSVLLIDPIYVQNVGIVAYTTAPTFCIDCRWYGGTTTKPDYW